MKPKSEFETTTNEDISHVFLFFTNLSNVQGCRVGYSQMANSNNINDNNFMSQLFKL